MASYGDDFDLIGLGFASLVAFGGLIGFIKRRSFISLIAGVGSGAAVAYGVQNDQRIALGASFLLLVVMARRYLTTGKMMPAGIVTFLSAFMTMRYCKIIFG